MLHRNRWPLYALYTANIISLSGNKLAMLAIPWFVLSTTGSAAQTGISAFFNILPIIIAAFLGGALVDRLGYRRSSIVSDVASGVTVALIPLLYSFGLLPFWILLVLVFFGALFDAPGATARKALVPELAERAGITLARATALNQTIERASFLLGAPLSGLLIALIGAQQVLWFNAASFVVSALLVLLAIPRSLHTTPPQTERKPYLSELNAGLQFIWNDRLIRTIIAVVLLTNGIDAALSSVLLPVYASEIYNSSVALGLMFGFSGGGAVIGSLVYAAVGERFSRRWVFICSFILVSLPVLVFVLLPPLPVLLFAIALMGFAAGPLNPIISTIQYERVPVAMRGRVFGAVYSGAYMAMPLGVLLGGYGLEWLGIQPMLIIMVGLYLLVTSSMLFNRSLREMDHNPEPLEPAFSPAKTSA